MLLTILICVACFLFGGSSGAIGAIFAIKKIQAVYGLLSIIPEKKWLQWLIGTEHLWKNYSPKTFEEFRTIKNKIRTDYPVLTMIMKDTKEVVLNTKTIQIKAEDVLKKINELEHNIGIWK